MAEVKRITADVQFADGTLDINASEVVKSALEKEGLTPIAVSATGISKAPTPQHPEPEASTTFTGKLDSSVTAEPETSESSEEETEPESSVEPSEETAQ